MTAYFAAAALLEGGLARDVRFDVADGRFVTVAANSAPDDATRLSGVVLPGLANCHSHAFHRALRGRTHDGGGTFWTWRERMYDVAGRLDPETYLALARATYAEMALAGITAVGEFHYLHHGPGGAPYAEPNVMAEALRQAAVEAGIRLTLLDACYLAGGLASDGHTELDAVQRRFADADADAWAARAGALVASDGMRVGVALHSVRAVPREAISTVRELGQLDQLDQGRPLHAHVSEQPAENDACLAFYGCTPTVLLDDHGVLGPHTTAVHATHLTDRDIAVLGRTATTVCFCPSTEADLADGIGPGRQLTAAGAALSLGSDQHAVIDLLTEARGLELGERLRTGQRGCFRPDALLAALTRHDSLGWDDAGALAVGRRADLVAVRTDTVRTAGVDPAQLVFAATAADVDTVIVDGRVVVSGGVHVLGDVARLLADAIAPLTAPR